MIRTIYISRHGARQDWINPDDSISVTGMYHDPSLSEYGLSQVEELGDFLSHPVDDLPVPDMIFSSGFYRCLQTARPLAAKLGKPVHVELGVGEWFSKASEGSGLHSRPHAVETLSKHFAPTMLEPRYKSTVYPSRRGEDVEELRQRIKLFLGAFIKRIESEYPDVQTISIIAHAATVIVMGQVLLDDETKNIKAGTASTSCYTRDNADGPWAQRLNGETSYLSGGEVRNWSFDEVKYRDGKVIEDRGDGKPFTEVDELPVGLGKDFERYSQ
ncbi:histidine phosphatase superfamily [Kockovaella imperatae]|uniref:Histidine phosphatase superfamily n=1 Tax=Kockovaella imperatae TaxID=4999 RepID=A0A1Y1U7C2_9TREE|nr:histidine phosphatase superfamily [Kockovaella imperatae]ORX33923.1 histidine phosphatase superfamily [Kockovaella imperatae]